MEGMINYEQTAIYFRTNDVFSETKDMSEKEFLSFIKDITQAANEEGFHEDVLKMKIDEKIESTLKDNTEKYKEYQKTFEKLYNKKYRKSGYSQDKLYDEVAYDVILAATLLGLSQSETWTRLGWRINNFFKLKANDIVEFSESSGNHCKQEDDNTEFEFTRSEEEIEESELERFGFNCKRKVDIIESINSIFSDDNTFADKHIFSFLLKISENKGIEYLLKKPIEDLPSVKQFMKASRQTKDYRAEKVVKAIKGSISETYVGIHSLYDGFNSEVEAIHRFGNQIKDEAKQLQKKLPIVSNEIEKTNERETVDVQAATLTNGQYLILTLLKYFQAALIYKHAITLDADFLLSHYNYSYCMKRLGKLNGALSNLDISNKILVSQSEKWDKIQSRKSMIQECIGDTYLIKRDYKNALTYFNKAEVLNQQDIEVKYNLLECYCEVNSETEVENVLKKIADMNAKTPKNREELLFHLLRRNNRTIKDLVKHII